MTSAPQIRDFNAWINLRPGSPSSLIVTGEVETSAGNKQPRLMRAEPQGIVAEQLILDLTIIDIEVSGTQDVGFRTVRYEEPARRGQYTSVLIRWGSGSVATLHVSEAH